MSATYLDLSSQGILQQKSAVVSGNVPYGIVALTSGGVIHASLLPESMHTLLVVQDTATTTLSGIHTIVVASGDAALLSDGVVRIQTASDVSEGSGQGSGVSDGDKGDIVVVSGQWLIKNQAVTASKMQQFPSLSLLGTTPSGVVTSITVGYGLTIASGVLSAVMSEEPVNLPTSGLLGYWTASQNVVANSEMRVSQWNPVTGSHALTQSDPALRPLYFKHKGYDAICFPVRTHTGLFSSLVPATGQASRSFAFVYLPFSRAENTYAGLFSYGDLYFNAGFCLMTHVNNLLSYAVDFVVNRYFVPVAAHDIISGVVVLHNNIVTVVFNGDLVFRQDVTALNINTGSSIPLRVGMAFAGTNEGTTGLLFDFAVWNTGLTEEQAKNVSVQFMKRYPALFGARSSS